MKITRILLAGLVLCALAACGESGITGPDGKSPQNRLNSGYLGSAG